MAPKRRDSTLSTQPTAGTFLPTTLDEARARGWQELDVVLVTGDAYVDHPSFGAAIIGRVLEAAGYRVGVIAQPEWRAPDAFRALGRPRLFFGVTAGNMDSMVNHYTAHKRRRSDDAYSPDGRAGLRPDRASIVYAQRCREAYKDVPIVLGGVEASLRRISHYDYWDDSVRRSCLLDAKADLLVFGQGEKPILEVAARLAEGRRAGEIEDVAGVAVVRKDVSGLAERWGRPVVELPAHEEVASSPEAFARLTRVVHEEGSPSGAVLAQRCGGRVVVLFPPMPAPTTEELDRVYELPFARAPHPKYAGQRIPAWEQIKFSVTIVRGCGGGCSFCALSVHQGRDISSRSVESVLRELTALAAMPDFRGTVSDLGGPTANFWGSGCGSAEARAGCKRPSCLWPKPCPNLRIDHAPLIELYRKARQVAGVRHVFVASGVRYDLAHADARSGERYLAELCAHHVSGQLKIAPEHVSEQVLRLMRKPPLSELERFRTEFERMSRAAGKEQYLVPYFVSSHPGSTLEDAAELHDFLKRHGWKPQQVQDFMPTPMTAATAMFHTGLDPTTLKPVPVERDQDAKRMQKALLRWGDPELAKWYRAAMERLGRTKPERKKR